MSLVPFELVRVWTTWLIVTVSARAGTAVKTKINRIAANLQTTRRLLCWGFLTKILGAIKFILFEQSHRGAELSLSIGRTLLIAQKLQPHAAFLVILHFWWTEEVSEG